MSAYHQMGHDSSNLLVVSGYAGAIISPVNEVEADVVEFVKEHRREGFEFIFDPQLYFPRRGDRGKLGTWGYFPRDFETADFSSTDWWAGMLDELVSTAVRVGASKVCSPAFIAAATLTNSYYDEMRGRADLLVEIAAERKLHVLQTVVVRLGDLANPTRALEIASIVSNSRASGIYLVMLSDLRPREELRDVDQLKGAMLLINSLEVSGIPVLVGCCSSDLLLWKAAGATSCATGKFANLRRFTEGRFNETDEGGRQMPYWFEEKMLSFLRGSDIQRVQQHGLASANGNPFAVSILAQFVAEPTRAWVGLGWRQYMYWFAEMEARLRIGTTRARDLVRSAEQNWQMLEEQDVFMEEPTNDGRWLRAWLRAIVEFNRV